MTIFFIKKNFFIFQNARKTIFILIIALMLSCFAGFGLIPRVPGSISLNIENAINIQDKNIIWCSNHKVGFSYQLLKNFAQKKKDK